ncbi:hypothetical protein M9434_002273 [Picochlorum sp. BPE23]|nr:hypothetical protein M9435_006530 [Picochlorum sp. BPE23]KAI8114147.1 hypothetical protein M9434_002273 [Picochlorum sp. BPE23]WPT18086.1 hypothetical protein PSENEW3_00006088 [Picochlorum sp. SENEW3]
MVAAAVLFLLLYHNIATADKQLQKVDAHRAYHGSGYSFRARFPGVYGMLALDKLISWNDNLFAATMTMYKRQAQSVCSDLRRTRDACVNATKVFRPPEPEGHAKYDLFEPYVHCPSGQKMMKRVGNSGEGGKWLCDELLQKDSCVIFSLGSNGQYDFEKALLEKTRCDIYTFDCTYNGRSLSRRHKYVKKCIGSMTKAGENKNFVTLSQAAQEMRVKKIDLLKIDIEGYEFDEIAGWSIADFALPDQVSIEVHHSQVIYAGGTDSSRYKVQDFSNLLWPAHHLIASDLALFFGHFGRLGYAIVSREDNPMGTCCSEFLLLKVADWAAL